MARSLDAEDMVVVERGEEDEGDREECDWSYGCVDQSFIWEL